MEDKQSAESRSGYTLVVAPRGKDRTDLFKLLKDAGLEVAAAAEADVLATLDLLPPALVILDHQGSKDALQDVQRRLMSAPQLMGVPLLVLAYASDVDSFSGAITKGAAGYLVKPADPKELLSTVRHLSGWLETQGRTEKRRHLRRPLVMKLDVDIRSQKLKVPGQMLDVSSRGCRIEVAQVVPRGGRLRLVLRAPEGSTNVALGAYVRWSRPAAGGGCQLGLRFTGTTAVLAPRLLGVPVPGAMPGGAPGTTAV